MKPATFRAFASLIRSDHASTGIELRENHDATVVSGRLMAGATALWPPRRSIAFAGDVIMSDMNAFCVRGVNAFCVPSREKIASMDSLAERLRVARQKAGYESAADAVRAFGWTKTTYADHENGHRSPKLSTLKRYATAFGVPWLWLQEGGPFPDKKKPQVVTQTIPITGEVAAGQWLDVDVEVDARDLDQHPVAVHPDYPVAAQYGLIVRGDSMNRVFKPGMILHCVDIIKAAIETTDDDIVIVQRTRAQGSQREVTAKRINRRGRLIILSPDSTETKWKPITFAPNEEADPDAEEVRVLALVISAVIPLANRRRR